MLFFALLDFDFPEAILLSNGEEVRLLDFDLSLLLLLVDLPFLSADPSISDFLSLLLLDFGVRNSPKEEACPRYQVGHRRHDRAHEAELLLRF